MPSTGTTGIPVALSRTQVIGSPCGISRMALTTCSLLGELSLGCELPVAECPLRGESGLGQGLSLVEKA